MRLFLGLTGASGSIYAERLIQASLPHFERIYLVATDTGKAVARHELYGFDLFEQQEPRLLDIIAKKHADVFRDKIKIFNNSDFFAPTASGSSAPTHMVVLPCSMGTLARIACGVSSNLLERTADVMLKQKNPLILCPREAPFNSIHLENMLKLSNLGTSILPASPGFYNQPQSSLELIDFVVGKILDQFKIEHNLYSKWNEKNI